MPLTNAHEVFLHSLGDIYDAEHRFLEGQREMADQATDGSLRNAIQTHIDQTEEHIRNLEQVFGTLDEEPRRETCDASQGLVSEARKGIQEAENDAARDSLIDIAVVKVEHYEMASYRALISGARLMEQGERQGEIVGLLEQNLRQEEETARIAEQSVRELLDKAEKTGIFQKVRQAQGNQEQQEKGLMDKAKDKLTGQ
jgi:ferritin-like metal-binding protein YciE